MSNFTETEQWTLFSWCDVSCVLISILIRRHHRVLILEELGNTKLTHTTGGILIGQMPKVVDLKFYSSYSRAKLLILRTCVGGGSRVLIKLSQICHIGPCCASEPSQCCDSLANSLSQNHRDSWSQHGCNQAKYNLLGPWLMTHDEDQGIGGWFAISWWNKWQKLQELTSRLESGVRSSMMQHS